MLKTLPGRLRRITRQQLEILAVVLVCAVCYALTAHDDLLETSNHAWLLLDSIRGGRFLDFYTLIMEHSSPLYYTNNAHYNIVCYLLYAVWQLPVYLVCQVGGLAVDQYFLMFWSKAIGVAAMVVSALLLKKLALCLGLAEEDGHNAAIMLVLNPVLFFSAMIMSQYDTLCMAFTLAALLYWAKKDLLRCSIWMGVAAAFKFFPLLVFLPLLVLLEKRPLRCLGYAAISLWLLIPTGLLFRGRIGDMGVFQDLMIQKLFAATLPGGVAVPAFLLLYALLLAACYFYRAPDDAMLFRLLPWVGLVVYGSLFLLIEWHPQWLVLLVPFLVLTTLQQTQRAPWLYLDAIWFFGYWVLSNLRFEGQLESNLFTYSFVGKLAGPLLTAGAHNTLAFYLRLIPYLTQLAPVIFAAPLVAAIIGKFPLRNLSLADRLAGGDAPLSKAPQLRVLVWGLFIGCILIIWYGSALYVLCKACGL